MSCPDCAKADRTSCDWCGKEAAGSNVVIKGAGGRICGDCAELVVELAIQESPGRRPVEEVKAAVAAWHAEVVAMELELGHTLPFIAEAALHPDTLAEGQAEGYACIICTVPNPSIPVAYIRAHHFAAACSRRCADAANALWPRHPIP